MAGATNGEDSMADPSYQPLVYRKQGGNELVVASGGKITVESGGIIEYQSGAFPTQAVTVMTTTSGTITNNGLTTIGTTIASAYTLATPSAAGMSKTIVDTVHGATTVLQVVSTASTGVTFSAGATTAYLSKLTFTSNIQSIQLISTSTSNWAVVANNNGVAVTS
jgi:hypothetical protein